MPDNEKVYRSKCGFVLFDPEPGDINGRQVVRAVIETTDPPVGGHGVRAHLTIWPSHFPEGQQIKKGDWLGVSGVYSPKKREDGGWWHNISVTRLAIVKGVEQREPGSTGASGGEPVAAAAAEPDDQIPF